MGEQRIAYHWQAEAHPALRPRLLHYWRHVHARTLERYHAYKRRELASPWPTSWYVAALCVHSHEGAWNDPGAPYWGGMQMDIPFMQAYGPEFYAAYGTADRWPPHDQLVAAYRAWRVRGWTPWPSTARMCGLL